MRRIPSGGIRATQCGGNTIGAILREPRPRPDGYRHVDTSAMIARLKELGATTYIYGVWDTPVDWDDARDEFIPAAGEAGIDVWIYLVPPSETDLGGRASRPHTTDYEAWAREIASLSLRHPNLAAWAIDDFEFNQEFFTPEYVGRIQTAAEAVNPTLPFYLCTYFRAATDDEFLDKYAPFLDGLIYPFLDGHNLNTQVATTTAECLDAILQKTGPLRLEVVLLVYTGRFLDAPLPPDEEYAAEVVEVGLRYASQGRIQGVTAYGLQLDGAPATSSDNKAMYGRGRLSLAVPRIGAEAGSWAEASQVVRVDPDSPRHELSFWHFDIFTGRFGERGSHLKQILVDGEVVWSCDVLDYPFWLWTQGHTLQGPIDLSARMRGKTSVTLSLRLYEGAPTSGFPIDVGFDHLESIGFEIVNPGFETRDGWTLRSSHGLPLAKIDIFAPDRPQRVFDAVRTAYSRVAREPTAAP